MSLFKKKRIGSKSLKFTRFESDNDDVICDICKYQNHCDKNIRRICMYKVNHEITERGRGDRLAYIVKTC